MENDPESKRARIAAKARSHPKEQFNNLMHHLTFDLVREHLAKIPLKSAPGIDGMTVKSALENLDWILPPILKSIHEGNYEAPPVRRVYIPKANGGERPIGVPEIIDRAIQAAMAKILNEIYEQDFLNCSFGFRPRIGCHHALATINELIHRSRMQYALEVDIRDFFGSLSHDWLRQFLELRIGDQRILKLINAWLTAGVMEDGKWTVMEKGTPQGGSISPLLANIYLHYVLDLWFERKIKSRLQGKAHLVRYADDFVILFAKVEDVDSMKTLLLTRLAQFGLTLAEEKTHKTDLTSRENTGVRSRRSITFLGFKIFRALNRNKTGWKVVFQTEGKRLSRAKASMKEKLQRMMHWEVAKQAEKINSLLAGHFSYYGIAGNAQKIAAFRYFTLCYWRYCLSKRSQKGAVNWEKMEEIFLKFPLCAANTRISYPMLKSYVRL
jgi:RNA-directed DNA polymerase